MAAALPTTQVGAQTAVAMPTQVGGAVMPAVQTMPTVQYAAAPTYSYLGQSGPIVTYAGAPMASLPTSTWIQPMPTASPQTAPATALPTTVPTAQYVTTAYPCPVTYPATSYPSYPLTTAVMPQNMPTTVVANPAEVPTTAAAQQPVLPDAQASGLETNVSAPQLVQTAPTPTNTPVMQSAGTVSSVVQSLGAANTPVMQSQSPMAQSFVVVGSQSPMLTSLPAGSPVSASACQGFAAPMSLPATSASVPMEPAPLAASQQESEVKTQSTDLRKPVKKAKKGKNKFGCCGC